MSTYNYHALSPTEFENLARDIVQTRENIVLETFKEGKDSGIDMRYFKSKNNTLIVQAKRYLDDYKVLYDKLKKHELSKVKKLKPKRYILVTSVGLTPLNKKSITDLFSGFIKSPQDIIAKDDIDNLIALYPEIEKSHYKLWLTSTAIMQQILKSKEINQSTFELEQIRDEIKRYAMNESFENAREIIERERFVVISGIPGIGKTTLARMLAFHYLAEGYEDFIYVSGDIHEALTLYVQGKKQIFLYDDFLGGNFLSDRLTKNEDKRLLAFINRIKNDPEKILIMTTREYILRQAETVYPELEILQSTKATVELEKYTELIKAEILFNHLSFADIPEEYIDNILHNNNFEKLIAHQNYSPRIISSVIKDKFWQNITPEEFTDKFLDYLEKPLKIWENVYTTKISELSQFILKILAISGVPILVDDLVLALKKNRSFRGSEFKQALKELENTFVRIEPDNNGVLAVEFQNNSILDFLLEYLRTNRDELLELLENILFINHGFEMFELPDSMLVAKQLQSYSPIKHDDQTMGALRKTISANLTELKPSTKLYRKSDDKGQFEWKKSEGEKDMLRHTLTLFDIQKDEQYRKALLGIMSKINLNQIEIDREFYSTLQLISVTQPYLSIDIKSFIESCASKVNEFDTLSTFCELSRAFPDNFLEFVGNGKWKTMRNQALDWCELEFAKGIAPSLYAPQADWMARMIYRAEMERICEEINVISRCFALGIYLDPDEHKALVSIRLQKLEKEDNNGQSKNSQEQLRKVIHDMFNSLKH